MAPHLGQALNRQGEFPGTRDPNDIKLLVADAFRRQPLAGAPQQVLRHFPVVTRNGNAVSMGGIEAAAGLGGYVQDFGLEKRAQNQSWFRLGLF
jgi:hypothetical protein